VGDPNLSLFSVTVVNIWRGFPFTLVMLLAALQSIPDEMYEAARIDGASATKSFFYITLPSLKGTMMTVGLLDTIWTFRHFDIIFAMTGGGPMNSSEVLTTNIYNLAFRAQRWGYSSATAVMMFLLMLVFSLRYIRQIGREGV
jgi:multiple sugar transport system permease protein